MGQQGRRPGLPKRMAYAPATRMLREFFAASVEGERRGAPLDEMLGEQAERRRELKRRFWLEREQRSEVEALLDQGITRRAVLERAAALGLAVAAASPAVSLAKAASGTAPRIVIIGGGLAGIRTADWLWQVKGLRSTIYEADTSHVGGRCWSFRNYFKDQTLIGEHGGAFINTDQNPIRNLAASLGLKEEVVGGGDLTSGEQVYWMNGGLYTYAQASDDWRNVGYPAFTDAYKLAPYTQTWDSYTAEGKRLDNLNIPQWLDEVGIGQGSDFGKLMQSNILAEYGGEPTDQSFLSLLYLLAWNPINSLDPLPGYDEKLHIVGGNDQIVTKMVARLPAGTIKQGARLVAVRRNADGTNTVSIQTGSKTSDVVADHLVLALPFSTLRECDLSKSGFSARKLQAINELGMGTNAKIHVEVSKKVWPALGYSGSTYTDPTGYQCAWDDSVPRGANGPAILLCFPGGNNGRTTLTGAAHGPAPAKDVGWFLRQIEQIWPGVSATYTGRAYEDHWALSPFHHGAYSYWKVGQYTTFANYEGVQEGAVHFAGECTEYDQQGFLNGAVVSGERVGKEISLQV